MLKYYIFIINILFNLKLSESNTNLIPYIYKNLHYIEFNKNINKTKLYTFNIGSLEMISYIKNDSKLELKSQYEGPCHRKCGWLSTININKELNLKYIEENVYGITIFYQGILWWSYKPLKNFPPYIPFYNNKNYNLIFIELDINVNIITNCLYYDNLLTILYKIYLPLETIILK